MTEVQTARPEEAVGPLFQRLHELQQEIEEAKQLPAEVDQERQEAFAQLTTAQQALRRFYAKPGKRDARRERELTEALEVAEKAVGVRWDERKEGAALAVELAQGELHGFIRDNFDGLAAELIPHSVAAHEALRSARSALEAAALEWHQTWHRWRLIVEPVGLGGDLVPGDPWHERVPLPVPTSLMPLARQHTEPANDAEGVSR